ncbi:RBBP9/YdeN family alpha/beta hydrolase [Deinococcus cellulosilyticus]|uniref:Alpha/beta hydrolase n=1 Tax=Deinococcus cellulosilyticus (strain DSM 18568 / NBRC 106333 / KACC 11606 / 5516J-15) TaxID=1223518 RepID=A0A511N6W5_DEIC1|nr:alpha/beta fold hydrolase [Deinococcus cellulosilyticus]GEM48602.1 alpha/beta hydrolase [Deinococcus cellulosilyticus NBRC 106333 = KACC 11606]
MTRVLTLPGWGSSGPEHWQTLWEKMHGFQRIEQDNWERPDLRNWTSRLDEVIGQSEEPTVILAHSLGCQAMAHWGCCVINHPVVAVLMVAPPDLARKDTPEEVKSFTPMHLEPLPFRAVVVASTDDPYATIERSQEMAQAWGAAFINVGSKGHINSASGLGLWDEGYAIYQHLLEIVQVK